MTWTDADGTDHAQYRTVSGGAAITHDEHGRAATANLARRMIDMGFDASRAVTVVGENGGILHSYRTLAKLGKVTL